MFVYNAEDPGSIPGSGISPEGRGTKNDLHDPDDHDGILTHLEPDILECEVKWALGSITTNKTSGGEGNSSIAVELFQILKDDAVKETPSPKEVVGDSPP